MGPLYQAEITGLQSVDANVAVTLKALEGINYEPSLEEVMEAKAGETQKWHPDVVNATMSLSAAIGSIVNFNRTYLGEEWQKSLVVGEDGSWNRHRTISE